MNHRQIQKAFTEDNKKRIEEAVAKAEEGSFGEVVPCVVGQSSFYEEASAKAFLYSVIGVSLAMVVYELQNDIWIPESRMALPLLITSILICTGLFFYFFIHLLHGLKRRLLGSKRLSLATSRHAKVMFLQNEVFCTKNRTGILIFISLFEHQVHVLPDTGLASTVTKEQWDKVVDLIVSGIKNNRPAEGLIAGIEACGEILRKYSPRLSSDTDTNELKDHLSIGTNQ